MKKVLMAAVAALCVASAATAMASPGPGGGGSGTGGEVRVEGPCSGNSDWEFRLTPRSGNTLRVLWRVDSGIAGQSWKMSMTHNGATLASATRVTGADGEADLRREGVPNLVGTDTFTGTATNAATGETCNGAASI
jgi:opacity protein-like surface antigen